jgi:hypothetical protein
VRDHPCVGVPSVDAEDHAAAQGRDFGGNIVAEYDPRCFELALEKRRHWVVATEAPIEHDFQDREILGCEDAGIV